MPALPVIQAFLEAVKEGSKVYYLWLQGADARRMRTAIDAGEQYILTNKNNQLEDPQKNKLLRHYEKRFFAHNN